MSHHYRSIAFLFIWIVASTISQAQEATGVDGFRAGMTDTELADLTNKAKILQPFATAYLDSLAAAPLFEPAIESIKQSVILEMESTGVKVVEYRGWRIGHVGGELLVTKLTDLTPTQGIAVDTTDGQERDLAITRLKPFVNRFLDVQSIEDLVQPAITSAETKLRAKMIELDVVYIGIRRVRIIRWKNDNDRIQVFTHAEWDEYIGKK